MSIKFTAEVTGTRVLGDVAIVNVKYQPEGRKYPQYVDLKFPADSAPTPAKGTSVEVEFGYLPDARGYASKNINPNTGEPYINATLVLWKPKVSGFDAPAPAEFEDDLPW